MLLRYTRIIDQILISGKIGALELDVMVIDLDDFLHPNVIFYMCLEYRTVRC